MLFRFFLLDFPIILTLFVVLFFSYKFWKFNLSGAASLSFGVSLISLVIIFSNGTFMDPQSVKGLYRIIYTFSPIITYIGYGFAIYGFSLISLRLLKYA